MTSRHPLRNPVIFTGVAINVLLFAWALWASSAGPGALTALLVEDGPIEWLQFLCFSVLAVVLACFAVQRWTDPTASRLQVLCLAGLSVLVALAAGEEISWFQRVLNVDTPDFFRQHNRQNETNLHNLAVGDSSLNKAVVIKLMFLAGITHNLVLPLLALRWPRIRTFIESLGLYLPPLSAAVCYLGLVALSHLLIDHPRKGELGEIFGAVHYLSTVFAAYAIGVGYARPAMLPDPQKRQASFVFSVMLAYLLFMGWLLAAFGAAAKAAAAA